MDEVNFEKVSSVKHIDSIYAKMNNLYKKDSINIFFKDEVERFDLNIKDSVQFIFYYDRAFDTSFVLLINVSGSLVTSNLYYLPKYFYSGKRSPNKKPNVVLYNAINFKIKLNKWHKLLDALNENLSLISKEDKNPNEVVIHPSYYKFYFGNYLISNMNYNNEFFYKIHVLLLDEILNDVLAYQYKIEM